MDSELGAALEKVLSDPDQMEKLSQMARELFGPPGEKGPPEEDGRSAPAGDAPSGRGEPAADARLLTALSRAFSGRREPSRSTALLLAMRPYMRPEKQEKLDRAGCPAGRARRPRPGRADGPGPARPGAARTPCPGRLGPW